MLGARYIRDSNVSMKLVVYSQIEESGYDYEF